MADNKDKKRTHTSMYVSTKTVEALENLDLEIYGVSLKTNSDKIMALVNYYKEQNNK